MQGEGEEGEENMKTPSLGLVWSAQVACRVVLRKVAVYSEGGEDSGDGSGRGVRGGSSREEGMEGHRGKEGEGGDGGEDRGRVLRGWRRWLRVVFAPWVRGGNPGLVGSIDVKIGGKGGEKEVEESVEYVIGKEGIRSISLDDDNS